MPVIRIWDAVGLGVIISYPTGILIANQTGGTACLQSGTEGIYLPLCNDYDTDSGQLLSPATALAGYFQGDKYGGTGAVEGIDRDDADFISSILFKFGLQGFITVDSGKLQQSHEAWIHVIIDADKSNSGLLSNFTAELKGVLTWSNSD